MFGSRLTTRELWESLLRLRWRSFWPASSGEVEVPPAKAWWCRSSFKGVVGSGEVEVPPAKAWWCRSSFEGDVGSGEVEVPPAKAWWCRSSFEGDVGSCEVEVPPAKARWRGAFLNPEFTQYYPCAPNHLKRF